MKIAAAAWAVSTLLVWAPSASAASDDERVRRLVKAAGVAYNIRQFQEALNDYTEAYRIKPLPQLLYNIGQCHRQLAHYKEAEFYFQRFLTLAPRSPSADTARQLLQDVQEALKREAENATPEAPPATGTEKPGAPPPLVTVAPRENAPGPPAESVAGSPGATGGGRAATWVGVAVAVAGAAALGTGAYFGVQAGDASRQVSQLFATGGTWDASYQTIDARGRTSNTAAILLMGVGGAAIVAGGVTAVLGATGRGSGAVVAAPLQGGAAVAWAGRF